MNATTPVSASARAPRYEFFGKKKKSFAVLASVATLLLISGMPTIAAAQEDISQKTIASLELEQADVREALRALFKNVNVSYSIAPEVQGPVTVSLKSITFETALQNILRQVDATYRIEAGVYEIIKRTEMIGPNTGVNETSPKMDSKTVRRIKIRSADPQFIAMMIGQKEGNQSYTIAPEKSTIDKTQASGSSRSGRSGMGGGSGGSGGTGGGGIGGGSNSGGGSSFGGSFGSRG